MSRRKKSSTGRRARQRRGAHPSNLFQRVLIAISGVILVLCAASITYGFFIRRGGIRNGERIRMEVLNGTGQKGIASVARDGLRRRGVDVIRVGNAIRFDYAHSYIAARREDADIQALADALGCGRVVLQDRKGSVEDATLILGADYRKLRLDWNRESGLPR